MASWQILAGPQVVAGNGMIATQDIQKEDLILQEGQLITVNTRFGPTQWTQAGIVTNFYADERSRTSDRLNRAVSLLNAPELALFNLLYRPAGVAAVPNQVVDLFEYNAFEIRRHARMNLVVNQTISAINHSCVPNANLDICEGSQRSIGPPGQARLVATKNIQAGSEISISYIANSWLRGRTARAIELQHWHFACGCEGCAAGAQIDTHERASARIYQANLLNSLAALNVTQLTTHIARLQTYIHLLGSLGRWTKDLSHA